ncbi:hypothetical protein [Streptomyces puniciscabiei]|uniref:hypothetical protein n=1 Tax=Streptomyces puniciscabiei TaxID=164348 RepID=UPI00333087E1
MTAVEQPGRRTRYFSFVDDVEGEGVIEAAYDHRDLLRGFPPGCGRAAHGGEADVVPRVWHGA